MNVIRSDEAARNVRQRLHGVTSETARSNQRKATASTEADDAHVALDAMTKLRHKVFKHVRGQVS